VLHCSEGHVVDSSLLDAELEDSLSDVSELANLQTSRVLNLRAEQHATLDLPSFFNLFETTWNFVVSCEVICRKMFVGLRGAILAQSKEFLSAFHAQRHSLSAKVVEEEMWAPVEVNKVNQDVVNMLVDGAVQDPACLKLAKSTEVDVAINGSSTAPSSPNGSAKPATGSKFLYIENRTFYAVGATLQVLSVALDYIKVIVNLPVLTLDTMSRMVELLKAFNSRTCQVVLGAGAMRSAGLKNITAKHLGNLLPTL
jgi:vacuolar protein sorting-associated protein 54